MKIKAIIHPAEEGGYWMEEVLVNLKDAIEGWLDVALES
jgi:predicted RNase H-like HicB family nuclease